MEDTNGTPLPKFHKYSPEWTFKACKVPSKVDTNNVPLQIKMTSDY
jgi:hypothetical protein